MSRFANKRVASLLPYTPGEQPQDKKYIKLNTNESPFPPSEKAVAEAAKAAELLNLYPDPECNILLDKAAEVFGVQKSNICPTNGSDEILNFAFMAYCDESTPAVFADITYGFYKVFANLHGVPFKEIPLLPDFSLDVEAFKAAEGTLFIANPNAPTGIALPLGTIEEIVASKPDRIVLIDEAYVDFGGESAVSLINKYDNLLVTQTFSKSRSLAGGRLGFGFACEEIIRDMNTIRYSTNPYNINKMTMAAGVGSLADEAYTKANCQEIINNREFTADELRKMGFYVVPSCTNFLFAKSDRISGEELYIKLKENGVLVRHFGTERLTDYNRITIGTKEQMEKMLNITKKILEEAK